MITHAKFAGGAIHVTITSDYTINPLLGRVFVIVSDITSLLDVILPDPNTDPSDMQAGTVHLFIVNCGGKDIEVRDTDLNLIATLSTSEAIELGLSATLKWVYSAVRTVKSPCSETPPEIFVFGGHSVIQPTSTTFRDVWWWGHGMRYDFLTSARVQLGALPTDKMTPEGGNGTNLGVLHAWLTTRSSHEHFFGGFNDIWSYKPSTDAYGASTSAGSGALSDYRCESTGCHEMFKVGGEDAIGVTAVTPTLVGQRFDTMIEVWNNITSLPHAVLQTIMRFASGFMWHTGWHADRSSAYNLRYDPIADFYESRTVMPLPERVEVNGGSSLDAVHAIAGGYERVFSVNALNLEFRTAQQKEEWAIPVSPEVRNLTNYWHRYDTPLDTWTEISNWSASGDDETIFEQGAQSIYSGFGEIPAGGDAEFMLVFGGKDFIDRSQADGGDPDEPLSPPGLYLEANSREESTHNDSVIWYLQPALETRSDYDTYDKGIWNGVSIGA